MKTINLKFGDYEIEIQVEGMTGRVFSNLRDTDSDAVGVDDPFNAAVDGMESLLLAMACQGVDLETDAMSESIQTAIDSISNEYGD